MRDTNEATRASLILRLKDAEDVAAWDEFFKIYGPVVYRVATSRGFQSADAENLVQEVFIAVANGNIYFACSRVMSRIKQRVAPYGAEE